MYLTKHIITSSLQEVFDNIISFMVETGWEIYDNLSSTNKIMRSRGESDTLIKYMYSNVYISTNYIFNVNYGYWDNITHTGYHALNLANSNVLFYRGFTNEDIYDPMETFFVGSKDYFIGLFIIYDNAIQYFVSGGGFGTFSNTLSKLILSSNGSVSVGTNIIVSLDSVDSLLINNYYQILDKDFKLGGERVQIKVIDTVNKTVTLTKVNRTYPNGVYLGYNIISLFTVEIPNGNVQQHYPFSIDGATTTNGNYRVLSLLYASNNQVGLPNSSYPMVTDVRNILNTNVYIDMYTGLPVGHFGDDIKCALYTLSASIGKSVLCLNNNGNDVYSVRSYFTTINNIFSVLTDSRRSWIVNEHKDRYLVIISGMGAGQSRKILSNTTDTLTLCNNFILTVDRSSQYIIVDTVYRIMSNQLTSISSMSVVYKDVY